MDSNLGDSSGTNSKISSSFIFLDHHLEDEPKSVRKRVVSEETKLRELIAQLRTARSTVQASVVSDLESLHGSSPCQTSKSVKTLSSNESRTADLEMAVLVQVGLRSFVMN